MVVVGVISILNIFYEYIVFALKKSKSSNCFRKLFNLTLLILRQIVLELADKDYGKNNTVGNKCLLFRRLHE